MKSVKPEYAQVYDVLSKEGFQVENVITRYDSMGHLVTESDFQTPYVTDNDVPVTGHATVRHDATGANAQRVYDADLFADGHNLSYMQDVNLMHESNQVAYKHGCAKLMAFASAAAEYPHVQPWSEYEALTTVRNREMNERHGMSLDAPTEQDYQCYLESVAKQQQDGIRFVGNTSLQDAYQSTASFEDLMNSVAQNEPLNSFDGAQEDKPDNSFDFT